MDRKAAIKRCDEAFLEPLIKEIEGYSDKKLLEMYQLLLTKIKEKIYQKETMEFFEMIASTLVEYEINSRGEKLVEKAKDISKKIDKEIK